MTDEGKKTYCMSCKDFTETIIIDEPGILNWILKTRIRICRKCAKRKQTATLEE